MTVIQQSRYDQLLRRVADLKGPGSKVNDALTELFPMIDVENLPAELLLLSGSRLCMASGSLASNVGFFTQMFLRNPTGSGVVARLIMIECVISAQTIVFGPTLNSSTALGGEAFADTRVFGEGTALKLQGNNNFGSAGSTFWQQRALVDLTLTWAPPGGIAVIAPGAAFSAGPLLNNQSFTASWLWIERQAQPSELNL